MRQFVQAIEPIDERLKRAAIGCFTLKAVKGQVLPVVIAEYVDLE